MQKATTPYNFVPLAGKVQEAAELCDADRFHADRHTGWFDLEITTLTPTYVREARRVEDSEEGEPSGFFWGLRDGKIMPLIPGSSLRGVVRSLFEIITCSHMDFISPRRLFYRSFASTVRNFAAHYQEEYRRDRLVAGVLFREGHQWYLRVSDQPTTKLTSKNAPVGGAVDQHHGFLLVERSDPGLLTVADASGVVHRDLASTDRSINIVYQYSVRRSGEDGNLGVSPNTTAVEIATVTASGGLDGWLVAPGKDIQPRHYYQVILNPQQGDRLYPVPDEVMDDYLTWGQMAHGARFVIGRTPRRLKDGAPAFAILDKELQEVNVIGANMMMPLRYGESIKTVAEHTERGNAVHLDVAQAVFGRISDERSREDSGRPFREDPTAFIKSRVFVEDAVCQEDNPWLRGGQRVKIPDVLSGPKPTAFQTYLQQGSDLRRQNLWDTPGALVRGRKMYWHRSPDAARAALHDYPPSGVRDSQMTRITPVSEGVVFWGRIRFENLTDEELGALYASIQLPQGLAHKIGMGKNLGLGSVRVEVQDTVLLEMPDRFTSLDPEAGSVRGEPAAARLKKAYHAFLMSIGPYASERSLWKAEWTRALAAMLSWDKKPADDETRQIGVKGPGSEQWRYRWPLPTTREVGQDVHPVDIFPLDGAASPGGGPAERPDRPAQPPRQEPLPRTNRPPERREAREDRRPEGRGRSRSEQQEAPVNRSPRQFRPGPQASTPSEPRPDEQERRPRAPKPAPTSEPSKPTYRQGDRVNCKVVSLSGTTATVELPDGSPLSGITLYMVKVGDIVKLRVIDAGRDGKVKKLAR